MNFYKKTASVCQSAIFIKTFTVIPKLLHKTYSQYGKHGPYSRPDVHHFENDIDKPVEIHHQNI